MARKLTLAGVAKAIAALDSDCVRDYVDEHAGDIAELIGGKATAERVRAVAHDGAVSIDRIVQAIDDARSGHRIAKARVIDDAADAACDRLAADLATMSGGRAHLYTRDVFDAARGTDAIGFEIHDRVMVVDARRILRFAALRRSDVAPACTIEMLGGARYDHLVIRFGAKGVLRFAMRDRQQGDDCVRVVPWTRVEERAA